MLGFKNERFVWTRAQFLRILQRFMTLFGGPSWRLKIDKNRDQNLIKKLINFLIDFWSILGPTWLPKSNKIDPKIDQKSDQVFD